MGALEIMDIFFHVFLKLLQTHGDVGIFQVNMPGCGHFPGGFSGSPWNGRFSAPDSPTSPVFDFLQVEGNPIHLRWIILAASGSGS